MMKDAAFSGKLPHTELTLGKNEAASGEEVHGRKGVHIMMASWACVMEKANIVSDLLLDYNVVLNSLSGDELVLKNNDPNRLVEEACATPLFTSILLTNDEFELARVVEIINYSTMYGIAEVGMACLMDI
jgi:hypothetical protein